MRVLDLFSGIGGFSLGLERAGMETVAFCEYDKKAQLVLKKHWPEIPIYDDVRQLTGKQIAKEIGTIDLICGGFPCQDVSSAGKCAGIGGERSGLWKQYSRLIGELQPQYVIVENVTALLSGGGMSTVLGDLASIGYDTEWHCIPGFYVGSPQGRDRVWIIAYPFGKREFQYVGNGGIFADHKRPQVRCEDWLSIVLADSEVAPSKWESKRHRIDPQPLLVRDSNGVSCGLDRLKQLGNAVVPQVVELIGRAIMEIETNSNPRRTFNHERI